MTSLWECYRKENMIEPLGIPFAISKSIPAAFDDSVSYLEMLMGVLKKQKDLIDQVNKNTEFIENWEISLDDIQAQIDELKLELENYKDEVPEIIDAKIDLLRIEMTNLLETSIAQVNATITSQVSRLDSRIDNIAVGDIYVYDPTTGLVSPIQQVINNLYDSGRDDALNASEFDALELGAKEYDDYEITAYLFDTKSKEILVNA